MLIGIDFDNTIVCYDRLFHALALERGLITADLSATKTSVRDYLRSTGREDEWTELQGLAYGPEMHRAELFPGVLDFLREARSVGMAIVVVSHKTPYALRGIRHDLHASAREFLKQQGLFDAAIGLTPSNVFFEPSKAEKLARIASEGCTHFIDDLPEFLDEPAFPNDVRKILFDPQQSFAEAPGRSRLNAWSDAARLLGIVRSQASEPAQEDIARLLNAAGLPSDGYTLTMLAGGRNNRAFVLTTDDERRYLLKWYFGHRNDSRDRLGSEFAFLAYCKRYGIAAVPTPFSRDDAARLALYDFVEGVKLTGDELDEYFLSQAIEFFRRLQAFRHTPEAAALPNAAEACFSIREHCDCIEARVRRLIAAAEQHAPSTPLRTFVLDRLAPAWKRIEQRIIAALSPAETGRSQTLTMAERCLSPSDFGFHNAIRSVDGVLRLIDFEYAGWDDPAKVLCDFFCQIEVPVPIRFAPWFAAEIARDQVSRKGLLDRAERLFPAYRIKWCCIVLNDFLSLGAARRSFGSDASISNDRLEAQLAKAIRMLNQLEIESKRPIFQASSSAS